MGGRLLLFKMAPWSRRSEGIKGSTLRPCCRSFRKSWKLCISQRKLPSPQRARPWRLLCRRFLRAGVRTGHLAELPGPRRAPGRIGRALSQPVLNGTAILPADPTRRERRQGYDYICHSADDRCRRARAACVRSDGARKETAMGGEGRRDYERSPRASGRVTDRCHYRRSSTVGRAVVRPARRISRHPICADHQHA